MKVFISKVIRRLRKEIKKVQKKMNPQINIPNVGYKTNSSPSIKIAVVGLGPQGHKLALYLHNMGYNVTAICDLNKKRLKSLKKKLAKTNAITDINELKKLNIDICILATLADSHLKLIKKLDSLGIKKVLSEKPITNNINDSFQLKEYINNNNIKVEVYHPSLFSNDIMYFKSIIGELNKGKLIKGNLSFKPSGIGNIGSHVLSTFLFITQIKVKKVEYSYMSENDGISRGDNYYDPNGIVLMKTEEGADLEIKNTKETGARFQKIKLEYEKLFINFIDGKKLVVQFKEDLNQDIVIVAKNAFNNHLDRSKCLDNAIVRLISDEKSHSLNYAIDAVEIIIASHLSNKNKSAVSFPVDTSTPKIYNFS